MSRLPSSLVIGLARLGPIGQIPYAPGTWGSAVGVGYFAACCYPLGVAGTAFLSVAGALAAVAICGEAESKLGKRDPGEIVLDEFVAMPVCFLAWPVLTQVAPLWAVLAVGFVLFRVFDILKPLGIRKLQELPGGWGVVIDDLAAALLTCTSLHLGRLVWAWIF